MSITTLSRSPSQLSTIECVHAVHNEARAAISALQEAYDQWPLGCPDAPRWRDRIRFAIGCSTECEATALLRGDTRSYERLQVSAALLAAFARQARGVDVRYRRVGSSCSSLFCASIEVGCRLRRRRGEQSTLLPPLLSHFRKMTRFRDGPGT